MHVLIVKWFIIALMAFGLLLLPYSIQKDLKPKKEKSVAEAVWMNIFTAAIQVLIIWLLVTRV
jgi:nitric oxide reductase large subunit